MKMFGAILFLVLALQLAGCSSSGPTPAPSPVPQAVPQPAPVPQPTPSVLPGAGELIKGTVYDSAGRILAGATVKILDGPQAGASATTDALGGFSLSSAGGMFDDATRFRATKEGHVAAIQTLPPAPGCAPCNPHRWVFFYLRGDAPPVDIAGDYSLTFIADGSCNLPDEARTRAYPARVTPAPLPIYPADTSFRVTLSGAPFLQEPSWNDSFWINVDGDYVAWWLGDLHGQPGFAEQISSNTYLAFGGAGAGTSSGSTISASFDGFIDDCALKGGTASPLEGGRYNCKSDQAVRHNRCESAHHQLILTRR